MTDPDPSILWLMSPEAGDIDPLPAPPAWYQRAACLGTDPALFFPEGAGASPAAALRLCGVCPVTDLCANYAAAERLDWGVWGGLTEQQRRDARGDDPTPTPPRRTRTRWCVCGCGRRAPRGRYAEACQKRLERQRAAGAA